MPIIGTLPRSEINGKNLYNRFPSHYSHLLGSFESGELSRICGDTFQVVRTTILNFNTTIKSWDDKPQYCYSDDPAYVNAKKFFEILYSHTWERSIANSEEISDFMDWTKSPGWPYTRQGIRHKSGVVPYRDSMFKPHIPIWTTSGKEEFKDINDILKHKIRVFTIPPFELLYSQLKFGKKTSLNIKNYHWSAYGFNPYKGGFNRLAQRLLSKKWRGCYDVSGWDKFLPLLRDIYTIMSNTTEIPLELVDEFLWMCAHSVDYIIRLPDGHVISKNYGNASGSGTTTRDNIFAHILIFAAGLYSAYHTRFHEYPSVAFVAEQVVNLFGDDNVYSLDDEFSLMCDEKFLIDHLAKFGLKLKFFFGGYDADLSILSFLGAHFVKKGGVFYPKYDLARLATSMLYEKVREIELYQYVSKCFTLMVMSYPHDEHLVFKRAYANLLKSELVLSQVQTDPTVASFFIAGVPTEPELISFYQGLESAGQDLGLHFLPDILDSV